MLPASGALTSTQLLNEVNATAPNLFLKPAIGGVGDIGGRIAKLADQGGSPVTMPNHFWSKGLRSTSLGATSCSATAAGGGGGFLMEPRGGNMTFFAGTTFGGSNGSWFTPNYVARDFPGVWCQIRATYVSGTVGGLYTNNGPTAVVSGTWYSLDEQTTGDGLNRYLLFYNGGAPGSCVWTIDIRTAGGLVGPHTYSSMTFINT
jgi:hypothetical protein